MATRGSLGRDVGVYNFGGVNGALDLEVGTCTVLRSRVVVADGTDVTIFASGSLPFKFQILNYWALVTTTNASVAQFRTETGGGGANVAEISMATAGYAGPTTTVPSVATLTPATGVGLFVRKVAAAEADLYLLIQRTS